MSKQKNHSPFGIILNIIGTAIIIAVIILCLMLTVPRFAGYTGYCVLTGSMEPTIPVGSLIYSKPTDPALLLLEGWLLNEIGRRLKLRG